MPTLYLDADACPVKEEAYRAAKRHGVAVVVVANSWMRIPDSEHVRLKVVSDGFDAADDWIVEHAGPCDVVVTGDIPLAARCLANGSQVLGHGGKPFSEDSIGQALATREFLSQMREHDLMQGGPAPFQPKDRSRFLDQLDKALNAAKRREQK